MTFISKVKQGAINGWYTHQILPSISIAQAILESASGTSTLGAKYNNLFGIKASDDWSGKVVNLPTREYGANGSYQINADFRWYDSWDDSMVDHAAFFTNTPWREENYKHVVGETDYKKAAQALQSAGYATDPQYATKLIQRIEQNNLTQYDTEAFNGKPSNVGVIKKVVGGTLTELAKSAVKQYNVTLIGDSLGVGTQPKLTGAFKSFTHDVLGSRQITHSTNSLNGTYVLQSLRDYGQLKDIVVVVLGTNRGVTDTEIDNFVTIAGNRKVIFVDTNSQVAHRQAVSDAYRRASERHNNVYHANWMVYSNSMRSRYYGSDNIHMTNEGYQAHADFIKMAVYEAGVGVKTTLGSIGTTTEYIGIEELYYKEGDLVSPKGESVIYNHPANELWGNKMGDHVIWIESILEVDSDDPKFILESAVKVMKDNSQPAAQYAVDLAELPDDVSIGDWGYMIDHEFNPPLYIHARVLEIITSETDLNANKAVIGNVTEVFPADKTDIKLIQADLKDARDNLVRDYRKGQPILMLVNSTNGSTLGDKYTETELVAKVTQGSEDLTNQFITYKWERVSNDTASDDLYNEIISTETTNRLIITSKDIVNNLSTFVVRVYDEDVLINQSSITVKHVDTALWTDTNTPPSDAKDGATWVDENGKHWILKDGEWEERVDQAQLFSVRGEVEGAIQEAEQAKADAIKAYNDAVAEAERLVTESDTVWQGKMDDYDAQVTQIEADVQSAQDKANQALLDVGISTDLAQTAKDLATTAQSNASTALSNASQAISDASTAVTQAGQAITSANTAKTNAQTAIEDAQSALIEAGNAKTTANSLSVKVNDLESEVELKASQTEVDGISGTVSTHTTTLGQHATQIASKADSSLVNTIKGTVDTHTTEISQNATAIASKASSSSVNALTGRVSTAETTISQHATSIASKASQTEVDTVKGTVSGHTSTLSQHASQISARLTSSQVNSLVDGKGLAQVTYVDNKIKATSDSFGVELTKIEGKIPTDYNNENLIGGYNKFKAGGTNSPTVSTSVNSSGHLVIDKTSTSSAEVSIYSWQMDTWDDMTNHFSAMLEDGDLITTSFMIRRVSGNPSNPRVYLSSSGMDYKGLIGNMGADWSLMYVTHTYKKDAYIQPHILFVAGAVGKLEIKSWQVERGSVATKHGASPKDALKLDDFNVFRNSYQSTVDGINTELSKTAKKTDLNGMVTESILATKQFVTQGSINTTLSNYLKTADLNGKVKETVAYQDIKETTDRYTRVIGSTDAESRTKIAQIAMTDSLFQTTVRDSIDVGGTNLYPNSTAPYVGGYAYNPDVVTMDGRLCLAYKGDILALGALGKNLVVGKTYTFSFYAKASANIGSRMSMHLNGANSPHTSPIPNSTFNYTTTWKRYSTTFEVKGLGSGVNVHLYPNQSSTGVFYIADWQLEEGNIVTAHSPAPEDKANQTQVTQLAGSWALTLKSGNDIKTQINASTNSIRLQSKFIHLNGSSLIDDATIKSAHIDNLNANKIVGNTADFNTIRTGVLTANAVTATHIKADTALFDTLFSTTSATNRLVAQGAWIGNANIISINADKINAGTISADRISTGSLAKVELGGTNLYNGSSYPQRLLDFYPKATATYAIGDGSLIKNCVYWTGQTLIALPALNKELVVGKTYTLSFYAKSSKNGVTSSSHIYINPSNSIPNSAVTYNYAWKRYKYTFTLKGSGKDVRVHLYPNLGSGDHFYIADFQLEEGSVMSAYSPAPEDDVTDLARVTGRVEIHGGNIKADTLDVGAITGNKASFFQTSWQGLNSNVIVDSSKLRLTNSAKDFIEMNGIPELRSQDSAGTAAIMGKGRSHYYSGSQARFYIGSNLEGLAQYGVHIAKGQTWGIYRNSDTYGGTPAQYHVVVSGESWRSITTKYWNSSTSVNVLMQLNGYNVNNYPVLQPGDTVLIKAAVAGNQSGVEALWTMGTSSSGVTRLYSHPEHVFAYRIEVKDRARFIAQALFENSFVNNSDRRIKHDIKDTEVTALDHLDSLTFKEYKLNSTGQKVPLGLIAQDSGILRVKGEDEGDYEGIDGLLMPMLAMKGVQELHAIVKAQAEEIKQLKEIINQ